MFGNLNDTSETARSMDILHADLKPGNLYHSFSGEHNMSVTIFTMTHKKFPTPGDPVYVPLQVGRAVARNLGYIGDDTGVSI